MDVIARGRCLVRLLERTTGPSFDGRTACVTEPVGGAHREVEPVHSPSPSTTHRCGSGVGSAMNPWGLRFGQSSSHHVAQVLRALAHHTHLLMLPALPTCYCPCGFRPGVSWLT